MEQVLVSGSAGFIGGYVVEELLKRGYAVVGLDDFSKYGKVRKSYDDHPRYRLVEGDARDVGLMTELLAGCDHFIAGAAMIGGISYFHTYAYDLLAANERISAASCDAAIAAHRDGRLRKVTYLSSSMVFESAAEWPSYEGQQNEIPPPLSSYGFQKLAVEYFARAAWDQYQLPYTLLRPFNCVGTGESRALGDAEILSGNVRLAMSHVVPDLVQKVLKGQDPLHILGSGDQVRHYTYGGDLAAGRHVQMVPALMAASIQGMTSSSIVSSVVVASKPSTRLALSVAGTRRWTSYSNGSSWTSRSGTPVPLIFRQMTSASCRTVTPSAVDRLKSSLRASGCSIAVTTPAARSPP